MRYAAALFAFLLLSGCWEYHVYENRMYKYDYSRGMFDEFTGEEVTDTKRISAIRDTFAYSDPEEAWADHEYNKVIQQWEKTETAEAVAGATQAAAPGGASAAVETAKGD